MSNVYKNQSFISKDRVRIPDVEIHIKQKRILAEEDSEAIKNPEEILENAEESDIEKAEENPDEAFDEAPRPKGKFEEEKPRVKVLKTDELKAIYEQELKDLASSVAQQAYYDALNKKKAELRDCINGVQALMDEMVRAHRQFIEDYTSELKYMAVDIAEKMILEKISEDDLILQRLVLQTISTVKNAEWLNVEVSERLVGLVDYLKKELEKPEYNSRAFVFPVAGSDSVCRIVTNEGAVVSTIEVQANNLRKAFNEFEQQEYPR